MVLPFETIKRREKTPMRQIREVLRLRFEQKLSHRKIAQSCGISPTAVRGYLKKLEACRLGWPLPEDLTDEKLEKQLFPPALCIPTENRTLPDFSWIHQELQRKGVTLMLLWSEYSQANSQGYVGIPTKKRSATD